MTTEELARLREIAAKARPDDWEDEFWHTFPPATVLALLDEIDWLRQEVEGWKRNADETLASRNLQLSIRKRVETENVTLRSRIEELERLASRVSSFGWGKDAPAELEVAILDLRRVLGFYD